MRDGEACCDDGSEGDVQSPLGTLFGGDVRACEAVGDDGGSGSDYIDKALCSSFGFLNTG